MSWKWSACRGVAISACAVMVVTARAAQTPSDVRPGHWAASSVTRVLQAGILRTQADGLFHGDSKMSRMDAAAALAKLGRMLVDGSWKAPDKPRAVPDTVTSVWDKTNWKTEPVRRYAFAAVLTRFGDYLAKGILRPAPNAVVGKSEVLPTVTVRLSPQAPGYESLTYLARNRMIKPGSTLLKADATALTGAELSHALADLAAGVNDRLTDLGKDANGNTKGDVAQKPAPR